MINQVLNPSSYTFSWNAVPVLIVGLLIGALGAGVLATERGSRISLAFTLLTWSVAVWLLGFALIYSTPLEPIARWWVRIEHIGVVLIPSTVYSFTLAIVGQLRANRMLAWASFTLSALCYVTLVFSDQFVSGVREYAWGYYPQYGWVSFLYLAFFLLTMVVSLRRLWLGYHTTTSLAQRQRLKSFLLAFGIAYLGSVDYLAAYGIPLYPFGYLPVFAFLVLSARAIRRYHLIDITPEFAAKRILNIMADALVVLDHEGNARVVNQSACKLFGKTEAQLLGARATTIHTQFFVAPPQPRDSWDYEIDFDVPHDGQRVLAVSASLMRDEDQKPAAVIYLARDISERKRAEQQIAQRSLELQSLSHRLIEVQENERKLLAADLHDTVVQWLSGTLYRIEVVRQLKQGANGAALHDELNTVENALQRSIEELRITISRLHPPELEMHGLLDSIAQVVQQWRRDTGIYIEFDVEGTPPALPLPVETGLYRICQEALNNIAKHAQASEVSVRLTCDDARVRLRIHDNGVGFDPRTAQAKSRWHSSRGDGRAHVGLLDMHERAQLIGGKLELNSKPGAGTTLTITVARHDIERSLT